MVAASILCLLEIVAKQRLDSVGQRWEEGTEARLVAQVVMVEVAVAVAVTPHRLAVVLREEMARAEAAAEAGLVEAQAAGTVEWACLFPGPRSLERMATSAVGVEVPLKEAAPGLAAKVEAVQGAVCMNVEAVAGLA